MTLALNADSTRSRTPSPHAMLSFIYFYFYSVSRLSRRRLRVSRRNSLAPRQPTTSSTSSCRRCKNGKSRGVTASDSIRCDGMGCNGMGWDGMQWDGIGWDTEYCDAIRCDARVNIIPWRATYSSVLVVPRRTLNLVVPCFRSAWVIGCLERPGGWYRT